eukprot:355366-Chlamydomonas_euryale.AAC.1
MQQSPARPRAAGPQAAAWQGTERDGSDRVGRQRHWDWARGRKRLSTEERASRQEGFGMAGEAGRGWR